MALRSELLGLRLVGAGGYVVAPSQHLPQARLGFAVSEVSIRFTAHAIWQLERRGLEREEIEGIVRSPQHTVEVRPGREIRQALTTDRAYLIRVVVDVTEGELVVVTMYKTSKIDRYRDQ